MMARRFSVCSKFDRRFLRGLWIFAAATLLVSATSYAARRKPAPPQVIAYIFPQNHVLQPGEIDARKLTRINYAFANIKDGRMVEGYADDAANFAALHALKKQNPSLTVLVSVGGWLWSGNFSDAVLTQPSRKVFIDSVMDFLARYDLDGLDIDWEYPGQVGAGNRFRPEDKQNYTLVLKELRERFNREEKKLHRKLHLSVAAGSQTSFLDHTEMHAVAKYLDTVNLMCYDYYEPADSATTGMNAPLFTDPADPKQVSADRSVREFVQAGVPAEKIVLGVPFYGHEWGEVPSQNNGLYQPGKPVPGAFASYGNITSTMLNRAGADTGADQGYIRYWNAAAQVPYLYNAKTRVFVSYDDPESMALKAEYALRHHLAGVMFWSYAGDPSGALLDAINGVLLHPETTTQ